jgi:hypothetical protein
MTAPPHATRGRGRALARHGDLATLTLRADPKRKRQYDTLLATMRRSRREEAGGYDAYWEAVGAILDGDLYVYGGYDTPDAFLAAEVKVPRRTALRMVRVARYASPADEERYGTAILDAALSYIEAKTGGPVDGKLPVRFEDLRIPVVRDGATHRLSLHEITFDELTAATRALARKTGHAKERRSPTEQALVNALKDVKPLAGVTVHVSDGHLRLGAIPLYALPDLARVLRDLELPTPATKKPAAKKKPTTRANRPRSRKPAARKR